ncbi:hypothetical protein [Marinilactibacillus kalidii]|uniref:hypothetical protein n=1 Tax=Marinilactibacillus kalidii TaxID=2820274 RepID=UPI001ABE380C|nr:hypothetical protein [Marinilactibacillus kalidii]
MLADKKLIEWLLHASGKSVYRIHKESGIPQATIHDLKKKVSSIEKMSFKNADLLTKYAIELKYVETVNSDKVFLEDYAKEIQKYIAEQNTEEDKELL